MLDDGVKGDVVSYSSVINACAKAGEAGRAEGWLQRMFDDGVNDIKSISLAILFDNYN